MLFGIFAAVLGGLALLMGYGAWSARREAARGRRTRREAVAAAQVGHHRAADALAHEFEGLGGLEELLGRQSAPLAERAREGGRERVAGEVRCVPGTQAGA